MAKHDDLFVLTDFIAKKTSQGLQVDILELEDLPAVTVEEIRGTMADWYAQGDPADDHQALLVGDDHVIPVGDAPITKPARTDDLHGSPADGDLDEETYVGRISHTNNMDLERQLAKTIAYMEDQHGPSYDEALRVAARQGAPGRYVAAQNTVAGGLYASAPQFQKIYGTALRAQTP